MSKIPKKMFGEMRQFAHPSTALYRQFKRQLTERIAVAEQTLACDLDPHQRDCWNDRLQEYYRQTAVLDQQLKDGWFVSESKCKGANGWFDWRGWFAHRRAGYEEELTKLNELLSKAPDEQARNNVNDKIAKKKAQLEALTTNSSRTTLPLDKSAEIHQAIAQLQKQLGDSK